MQVQLPEVVLLFYLESVNMCVLRIMNAPGIMLNAIGIRMIYSEEPLMVLELY